MPQLNSQNRIDWIDEFKGFVLLLVCLFHVEQSFKCFDWGMLHASAFRMSAFFFISGVLFSTRRFPNFKSYFIHKSKVLLFPYLILSFLFLLLDPVIYNFEWFPRAPRMTIMTIRPVIESTWDYIYWNIAKIFVAGKSSIGSGPIWFVFTLYSISLLFYAVQKITKGKKWAIAIFAAASLAAGWTLFQNHIRLPLGIERDMTTFFFFACGFLCKGVIQFLQQRHFAILCAISVISFVLYGYFEIPSPNFSIMNNDLGKSFIAFFASSAFGISGLVSAFILFSKIPGIAPVRIAKGILRNIARNGMIILAVHWWVLLVLRIVFKTELDKPGIVYLSILIVASVTIASIPLFRCKLHRLIGKERVSLRESLSIGNR